MRSFNCDRRNCSLKQYIGISDLPPKLSILFDFLEVFLTNVLTFPQHLFVLAAAAVATVTAPFSHIRQSDRNKEAREQKSRGKSKNERYDPL